MAFTFLHTADWQIGKPFLGFEPEVASVLRHARLTVIDRLAKAATTAGARHVVVCGDVFDQSGLPDAHLRNVLSRLAAHGDVTWHLLPGNHDPARDDGVWRRLTTIGLPGNVDLLLVAAPRTVASGVQLLPAPLASKAVTADPTAWMNDAAAADGAIRIGVAHGSTRGFGSSGTASVGIDPGRRRAARLDYLALGDWHGVREVEPATWYSGTPEPDQFPDNEPGFALLVSIDHAGAPPRVERIATAEHRWLKRSLDVTGPDDLEALATELAALGATRAAALVELTLKGAVTLGADARIASRLAAIEASLFHLRVRREGLTLAPEGDDIADMADPHLARVAARLTQLRADPGGEAAITAEGALRRLYALAARAGERAS